jgi:hypothetical protein
MFVVREMNDCAALGAGGLRVERLCGGWGVPPASRTIVLGLGWVVGEMNDCPLRDNRSTVERPFNR